MPCQFHYFTSLQACQGLTVLQKSKYKLIPKTKNSKDVSPKIRCGI